MKKNKDILEILNCELENMKKQKKAVDEYCEDIIEIMKKIKTEEGKQMLEKITQENYKTMLELDIKIGVLERELNFLKKYS